MRFRNLIVYRLDSQWKVQSRDLEHLLAARSLQPCNSFEMESHGWLPPKEGEPYLFTLNRHWLLTLGSEQKLLPASIIRQVAAERAVELEKKQGHSVGRKQMREIKERVLDELLPRALARRTRLSAWIDPENRWFVVDTSADSKAERLLENLRKSGSPFPVRRLDTETSPGTAMTSWLSQGEIGADFTIDRDLELRGGDENKATVRYANHTLEGSDVRAHITAGKVATRLGITWQNKISFVLTDNLQIKRVQFLNLLRSDGEQNAANKEEQFDLDFTLMTGELAQMLAALTQLLGGEKSAAA